MLLDTVTLILHDVGDELLLGGEKVVEGTLAQPSGLGDFLHRGMGHAVLFDQFKACVQHLDPQFLPLGGRKNPR